MKILILSDSLTLPREKPEVCRFEETWPELLRKQGHVVHQVSIGGATSSDLYRQCVYHSSFNPDVVILQVGVVDCAPRFLTKTEQNILKRVPVIGSKLIEVLNKKWVRKFRKLKYTPLSTFRKNSKGIAGSFKNSKCIFIGIIPATAAYEKQMPGIAQNIKTYNKALADCPTNFVSLENMPENCVMTDYHHLNRSGHAYIFSRICELL